MTAREIRLIVDSDTSLIIRREQIDGGAWEVSAKSTARVNYVFPSLHNDRFKAVAKMAEIAQQYITEQA